MLGVALRDTDLSIRDLVTLARAADDAGYASIWSPEVGSRDAIVLCSLYGANTLRAAVGTGVVPVYSRGPAQLAMAAATAADASQGRFVLGLGAGHRFTAERWFGGTWHDPRSRMRETVDVVRRLLAGERVDHSGSFTLHGFQLGGNHPKVPIHLAALTPSSLRLAGEVADGVILNWLPPSGVERASLIAREAAADAGRSIRVLTYVRCAVVEEAEYEHTVRMALREQTYSYASLPAYANSLRQAGFGDELDALGSGHEKPLDTLVDATCAWGSPEKVAEKLGEFQRAGLDGVVIYPVPFGEEPVESILHTIRTVSA